MQVYVPRARRMPNDSDPPSPSEVVPSPAKPSRHRSPNVVTPRKKSNKSEKTETFTLADRTPSCDSDIGELNDNNGQSNDTDTGDTNLVTTNYTDSDSVQTEVAKDLNVQTTESQPSPEKVLANADVEELEIKNVLCKVPSVPPTLKISHSCKPTRDPPEPEKSSPCVKKENFVELKQTDTKSPKNIEVKKTPQSNLNVDECSWDMMFDDNGDCLDPSIMDEVRP
jgi:hypothetical protein